MSNCICEGDAHRGERLRLLRKNAGITLQAFAAMIGYSVSHLSNVERGIRRPAEELVKCYEALQYGQFEIRARKAAAPSRVVSGDPISDRDDDFGTRLMRLRLARGHSLVQAADRTHISRSHLGNLETGRRRPTMQVAEACDEVYNAAGALIELAQRSARNSPGPGPSTATEERSQAPDLSMDPDAVLEVCTARLLALRAAGQRDRPHSVLPDLVRRAEGVAVAAARAGRLYRNDLWMLAARYAEFTGWMFQEAADESAMERWTQAAVRWASRAGDQDMVAYAWERRALVALYGGKAAEVVLLARQGVGHEGASARTRGLALRREAQGHALAKDLDAYLRTLDGSRRFASGRSAALSAGRLVGAEYHCRFLGGD